MRFPEAEATLRKSFPTIIKPDWTLTELPLSGSDRIYCRIARPDGTTLIGTVNADVAENAAFLSMQQHLKSINVNVPEVIAVSDDHRAYIQQDLGNCSLLEYISEGVKTGAFSLEHKQMMANALRQLARFHWVKNDDALPQLPTLERTIRWDLDYFKYCYLKPSGLHFDEDTLQNDFEKLVCDIQEAFERQPSATLMYRDFQSRNVMVHEGKPYLIDFQSGRPGSYLYDLVSFLWQTRANIPGDVRKELLEDYFEAAKELGADVDLEGCAADIHLMLLFRSLQLLGAYGFRGNMEGKAMFKNQAPAVLENISKLPESIASRYPHLFRILPLPDSSKPRLLVTVISFSYRKGLPEDETQNGGGFVFDCRAVHNPGRYEQYKQLTGRDKPVIDFLEKDGEIITFLDHAKALVDASVDRYVSRGFTNLQVAFGCTGGQHRSVYSAEYIAKHLAKRQDVDVRLIHREQKIDERL